MIRTLIPCFRLSLFNNFTSPSFILTAAIPTIPKHSTACLLYTSGYSAAIPWELKSRLTYTGNRESPKKKHPTCLPLPTIRDQLSFLLFFVLECFKNLNLSFPPTALFMHPVFYALFVPAIFFIPIQILQIIFHSKKRYPCLTTSVKSWISLL